MGNANNIKLTFTGDILCYAIQNEASLISEDDYSYDGILEPIKNILCDTDYLIGSLETTLAGKESGYTNSSKSFNTPRPFAQTLKKFGFGLLTTANNHCLDRGISGLRNTISCLNDYGIDHTGTYLTKEESEGVFIKDFDGFKIAFLSFTYGTNSRSNKNILKDNEIFHVDLFKKQDIPMPPPNLLTKLLRKSKKVFVSILKKENQEQTQIKNTPIVDNVNPSEISNPSNKLFINRLLQKISVAKEKADLVVLCMHAGGQFNFFEGPGEYVKYLTKLAYDNGVNIIIGNHTHCVLPAQFIDNKTFGTYSLGNFSFTPGDGYYIDGVFADYSVLLNLCIDKSSKEISSISFSVLKSIKDNNNFSRVYEVSDLYNKESDEDKRTEIKKDVNIIISKFINKNCDLLEVLKEYNYLDLIKT